MSCSKCCFFSACKNVNKMLVVSTIYFLFAIISTWGVIRELMFSSMEICIYLRSWHSCNFNSLNQKLLQTSNCSWSNSNLGHPRQSIFWRSFICVIVSLPHLGSNPPVKHFSKTEYDSSVEPKTSPSLPPPLYYMKVHTTDTRFTNQSVACMTMKLWRVTPWCNSCTHKLVQLLLVE